MTSNFEDTITSRLFTFCIGEEAKPIVVHSAAIAATSAQLDALINNNMAESQSGKADIKDIRVDDFIRFCEFAYRGDYTVPSWEEALAKSGFAFETPKENGNGGEDEWGIFEASSTSSKRKKGKKARPRTEYPQPVEEPASTIPQDYPEASSYPDYDIPCEAQTAEEPPERSSAPPVPIPLSLSQVISKTNSMRATLPIAKINLRNQLQSRNYSPGDIPMNLIVLNFTPKSNSASYQNYTEVFLTHARLYRFAHIRLVTTLKKLTLKKLHKTLMDFKPYRNRVGDIIKLAEYAYSDSDIPTRGDDGSIDDLRQLIVEYIVCQIDVIGQSDEFVKLMEEGGEFVGDFWNMAKGCMT